MSKMVKLQSFIELLTAENERLIREAARQETVGNMTAAAGLAVCAHEVEMLIQITRDVFEDRKAVS